VCTHKHTHIEKKGQITVLFFPKTLIKLGFPSEIEKRGAGTNKNLFVFVSDSYKNSCVCVSVHVPDGGGVVQINFSLKKLLFQ
jgi:hypothetical protein